MTSEDGLLLSRIVIERRITGDDDIVTTSFTDRDGDDPPFVETLGMLEVARDTILRYYAGDVPHGRPHDDLDDQD